MAETARWQKTMQSVPLESKVRAVLLGAMVDTGQHPLLSFVRKREENDVFVKTG